MSVTLYFRRVGPEVIRERTGAELRDLFRLGCEQRCELWEAGQLTSIHFHPALVDAVVTACGAGDQDATDLPVFGGIDRTALGVDGDGDGDGETVEYTAVTVLDPTGVSQAAAVLESTAFGAWMAGNRDRMREIASELGHVTPWDDDWMTRVRHDIEDLEDFYRAAADNGDAVVKYLDC